MSKPSLPLSKQIYYAIGQLGWSLLLNILATWLTYIYLPPKEAGLPILVSDGSIFVILNVVGIILLVSKVWDAITDPLIANWSDKLDSRFGRRIPFLAAGALPAGIFCSLIFLPPDGHATSGNLVWLVATLLLFYLFITMYVTPYFALIPELGHTPAERLNISTYISVTYFLGIALAAQASKIWTVLLSVESLHLDKTQAVQITLTALSVFAVICMYVPVFAIDEKKYSIGKVSMVPFKESIRITMKNPSFRYFVMSDFAYFLSLTILQTGIPYFITVLLGEQESMIGLLFVIMGVFSFACYPLVNWIARSIGKKKLVLYGFSIFLFLFLFVFFLGSPLLAMPKEIQAYVLVLVAGIPMAILGILPNAILADIAELDSIRTGSNREGLYYAGRTFMQKIGQAIGILLFTSLLLLGKDAEHSLGVKLSGPVAAIFCLAAILLFSRYREKETLEEIAKYRAGENLAEN